MPAEPGHPTVSLGFTEERFPAGVHICQIYGDDGEREESLLRFVLAGLKSGERVACFSERAPEATVSDWLGTHGVSCGAARESGAFTLTGTRDVYFESGRFDPDRMLGVLSEYYDDSRRRGYPAARVIGEMMPEVQRVPGGDRLMEYESRVSLMLRERPVTAVCQYDARAFDGAMIMELLKVHPYVVLRGSVIRNPFFIPPEEFLAR